MQQIEETHWVDPEGDPNKRVWQAVLVQMIYDLCSRSSRQENVKAQRDADLYLRIDNPDFLLVCENAGICPRSMIKLRHHVESKGLRWKAENGKGRNYIKRGGKHRYKLEQQRKKFRSLQPA